MMPRHAERVPGAPSARKLLRNCWRLEIMASMTQKVNFIPQGYHTATPYLIVDDARAALEFYRKAFGAVERFRLDEPDGRIGHAEIRIGDSHIMLADEHPEIGARSP